MNGGIEVAVCGWHGSLVTTISAVSASILSLSSVYNFRWRRRAKTRMFAGIFQGWSEEFWWDNKSGGGSVGGVVGWATYTMFVLLLISICQLSAKARFWLGLAFKSSSSSSVANSPFRSLAVVSPNGSNFKNTAVLPSIHSQFRLSEIISELDLKSLIDNLDEKSHEYQNWDNVVDRSNGLLSYSAKCCKPKDGPLKYLSVTIFENCSAVMLRDFYMDNNYRKMWDKTMIEHRQLQIDESNGTEIGCMIKKFPLLTAREYILAWRVWEAKDGTFYCFSKECEHPLAPRQKKYVRVEFFRSGWRIRKVPGRNACEIRLVHQEDAGLNVEIAKLAFAKGIWSYVCKMDNALRKYPANYPQSSLGATLVTLIQQVPVGFDTAIHISDPAHPETSATSVSCCETAPDGSGRKLSRRPSTKLIVKGIFLLGGLICMSRGHSNLGTKVAVAYIFTKLTNRGSSISQNRQA